MNIRGFVKKSLDNQKKLLVILAAISILSAGLSVAAQFAAGDGSFLSGSTVYRDEFYIELDPNARRPTVNVSTAGMPVEVATWNGNNIKVECVAELPLIIDISDEFELEITISQDDSFAVSIFTFDLFRYNLKVYLPLGFDYRELNVSTNSGNMSVALPEAMLAVLNTDTVRGEVRVSEQEP